MEIPLTNGGVALIDDADYHLVSGKRWHWRTNKGGLTRYASHSHKGRTVFMHRVILGLTDPHTFTDHVNHNGLDNRRCNLRPATPAQSQYNMPLSKANSSGYKGVTFYKDRGVWRAAIKVNRRSFHLGHFPCPLAAALAYDIAARTYFGHFACLNFPDAPLA